MRMIDRASSRVLGIAALASVAACFSADAPQAPCTADTSCPSGQHCDLCLRLCVGSQPLVEFKSAGSLSAKRVAATATLLPSGEVLIAEGVGPLGFPLSTAEIYQPATRGGAGIFRGTGNTLYGRAYARATPLPSGKVLFTGGLSPAELFGPAGNGGLGTFEKGPQSAYQPQCETATLLHNGTVLLAGGTLSHDLPDGGDSHLGSFSAQIFDPAGNDGGGSFRDAGSLSEARACAGATLLSNGKVLVVGGYGGYLQHPFYQALSSAELYDPASNGGLGGFSDAGQALEPRVEPTVTLLPNGTVLIAGGSNNPFFANSLSSAEIYDPAAGGGAGGFRSTGSSTDGRWLSTATLLPNGLVLVAGGVGPGKVGVASAELYDPAACEGAGAFRSTGSLHEGRWSATAALLPNGDVFITGGLGTPDNALASGELYPAH